MTKKLIVLMSLILALTLNTTAWAKTTLIQESKTPGNRQTGYCEFSIKLEVKFDVGDISEVDFSKVNKHYENNNWSKSKEIKNVDDLIDIWTEAANKAWNNSHTNTFGECKCPIKFKFNLSKVESGKGCNDYKNKAHCYTLFKERQKNGQQANSTYSRPNDGQSSTGEWSVFINPNSAPHEFGHAMGLDDEYRQRFENGKFVGYVNENPKKTDPQSIMAQTWGNVSALPEHVEAITSQNGTMCPGICCCGDGKVQKNYGEECDVKATINTCGGKVKCKKDCECDNVCGDGVISGDEECDPKSKKIRHGCDAEYPLCNKEDCSCEEAVESPNEKDKPKDKTNDMESSSEESIYLINDMDRFDDDLALPEEISVETPPDLIVEDEAILIDYVEPQIDHISLEVHSVSCDEDFCSITGVNNSYVLMPHFFPEFFPFTADGGMEFEKLIIEADKICDDIYPDCVLDNVFIKKIETKSI